MTDEAGVIFVALTEGGAVLARRLSAGLPGSQLHGLSGRVATADRHFAGVPAHLRQLYAEGRPIVAMFSTAIVIRALADVLREKSDAPPVLCVSEDGGAVVPLLGGHHGANALARRLGGALGVAPAITTAGEARFGFALDDPPPGWDVSGREAAGPVMAGLLAGEPVQLIDDLPPTVDAGWIASGGSGFSDRPSALSIRLTEKAPPPSEKSVALHPATLVLGVGCERGVEAAELAGLVDAAFAESGLAPQSLACIATIELKEDEAAVHDLASRLDRPVRLFPATRLEEETARLSSPSEIVFAAVGCHGVAEGAALAAAGTDAVLAVAKRKSRRATIAIARAPAIVDPEAVGRAPGHLSIVGIGPGRSGWRAPEASDAITRASDVVAYHLYIDLLDGLARGKTLHGYELGQERDRCVEALRLAAGGKRVALVSSGDAGIYAMASLVFELIDREDRAEWRRLAVEVVPGISALQALAARCGAPLGHDFCAVSLSDLLTPWAVIESRLRAAAQGDFVTALYNPVSRRRTHQLPRARDIFLDLRSPETPVALGRNLGRADETIDIIALEALRPDRVDMLTTVLIGSSTTRITTSGGRRHVYTPRGYDRKATPS